MLANGLEMSCADDALQSSSRFLIPKAILNPGQASASAPLSGYSKPNGTQAFPVNSLSLPGKPDAPNDSFAARSLKNPFECLIIVNNCLLDFPLLLLQKRW